MAAKQSTAPSAASETAKPDKTPRAAKATKVTRSQFEYEAFLSKFPVPGGEGAHVGFYRAGILGYKAGVTEDQIVIDVKAHMDLRRAGRIPSDSEIRQGVGAGFGQAVAEGSGLCPAKPTAPAPKIPADAFQKIVRSARGATVESIMAKSPIPIDFPDNEAGWRTIEALYDPNDILFIGHSKGTYELGREIRKASEWVEVMKERGSEYPHIIVNPLSGEPAPKKDGIGTTLRGDGNVVKFRNAVVEMDKASLEDQLAFWSWAALPVRALVLSGGKSIHAWVDVDCTSVIEWELEVEIDLFGNYLVPLGADPACKNEARFSRMPGHLRNDDKITNSMQKLIWLSPEGKAVCE